MAFFALTFPLVFALAFALLDPASAQSAQDGQFGAVTREVTVVRGTSRSAALVGAGVHTGDRVLTGANSAAAITLRDGTALTMGPGTRLQITQFLLNPETHGGTLLLTLARGTLRVTTGSIAQTTPDQFKVVTPTAVIAAQTADFIVEQTP